MDAAASIAHLRELMVLMREMGATQVRAGEIAIVLGPVPLPMAAARDPIDVAPHEETDDQRLAREYRDHLYGGANGTGRQ